MTPDTVVPPDSLMLKDGSRSWNCLLWTIRPLFQKHPSPALGWKKLFGRWVHGMQKATKHCPGSWGVVYILPCQRPMTLFSRGGPITPTMKSTFAVPHPSSIENLNETWPMLGKELWSSIFIFPAEVIFLAMLHPRDGTQPRKVHVWWMPASATPSLPRTD